VGDVANSALLGARVAMKAPAKLQEPKAGDNMDGDGFTSLHQFTLQYDFNVGVKTAPQNFGGTCPECCPERLKNVAKIQALAVVNVDAKMRFPTKGMFCFFLFPIQVSGLQCE
jgi:hypothetical protein